MASGAVDETIVITAHRRARALERVGSAITVIDAEDLVRHQDLLVLDALERVPGITVRRDGGRPGTRASVFIRGADSDQTLVLLDGIRLQDPSAPNAEAVLEHVAVEDIERIEILRGPQSVLYGSDAIGGVIHIITKQAEGPLRGTLQVEGGSYDTANESASLRGGTDLYGYALSLTHTDSEGFNARPGDTSGERDGYRRTSHSSRFRLGDEALGVDTHFLYLASEIDLDAGANFLTSDTESEQVVFQVAPHLELLGGLWKQRLSYAVNRITRDNDGAGFSLPTDFVGTLHSADWQHELTPADFLGVVLGGEFERLESQIDAFGSERTDETETGAFYLDGQVAILDLVDLTGGFRVEHHSRFGTQVTGRGTAAVQIEATDTTLRSSVGSAFKAPTVSQLFDSTFGSNNPNLEPEQSFGWDFGVVQQAFGDRARLELGYFRNRIDQLILADFSSGFVNQNISEARTQGGELVFDLLLFSDAVLRERDFELPLGEARTMLQYTFTETKALGAVPFGVTVGGQLLRRPEHELYWEISLAPVDCFDLTLGVRHVGDRLDLDPVSFSTFRAESYTVVDLAWRIRLRENIELFARLENLGDERYQDVAGFDTAGLSGYAGLRLTLP